MSQKRFKKLKQELRKFPTFFSLFRRVYRLKRLLLCHYYTLAIFLSPDWPEAHERLGDIFIKLNRSDEAVACWHRAVSLQPERVKVYYRIASAMYRKGQLSEMYSVLHRCAEVERGLAKARQLDQLGIRFLGHDFVGGMIGHLAMLGAYARMSILNGRSLDHTIVLAPPHKVVNPCYLNYWRRYFPVMITDAETVQSLSPLVQYLGVQMGCWTFPDGKIICLHDAVYEAETRWEHEGRSAALLTLTDSDFERGSRCLQELGVQAGAWFVSLHVREGDDEARGARNADVTTYAMACQAITSRGGWVIRMGDKSMTRLPPMAQVIDYAHSELKSDWMDVFLWAKCRFFLAALSGPAEVPPTFGVPCVSVNRAPLAFRPWYSRDLFIPKLYWSEPDKRFLTFGELLSSPVGHVESLAYLASQGIRLVDNTPEEMSDVVLEALERFDGTITYTQDDECLQETANELYFLKPVGKYKIKGSSRMGRNFLRKYAHLLV